MKEKKKIKNSSGSVRVDPEVLKEAKSYCKENGILVTFFTTEAIKDKLKKLRSNV